MLVSILIALTPRQVAELDQVKLKSDVSRNEIIRSAIDAWLDAELRRPNGKADRGTG